MSSSSAPAWPASPQPFGAAESGANVALIDKSNGELAMVMS